MKTNLPSKTLPFCERATLCSNKTAQDLFLLMDEKKTNLCFNPDVTRAQDVLDLVEQVGPYICLLKTHIDILEDFSIDFIHHLLQLAQKHRFLIFEDRKFADIGHTVQLQYGKGIYHIADWADITNAHIIAGPGTIEGLKKIGLQKQRGLLLLAEMSSSGNLATGRYTQKAIDYAKSYSDFVIGFIAMKKLINDPKYLYLTPGVQKHPGQDHLGQQYKTLESVIVEHESDIIIVGRGIYQAQNPALEAKDFATRAYDAYQKRIK